MPRVIQVIESDECRGEGRTQDDLCRRVLRYHALDGELLAERDTALSLNDAVSMLCRRFDADELKRIAELIVKGKP